MPVLILRFGNELKSVVIYAYEFILRDVNSFTIRLNLLKFNG